MSYSVEKISLINIPRVLDVTAILKLCGEDMFSRYGLNHWKNSGFKTFLIVCYTMLKNHTYCVLDGERVIATFQTKLSDDGLHFSKLAVSPDESGKGVGSFCLSEMEKLARMAHRTKLACEVYDKSERARDFYLGRGFEIIGQTETLKYTELVLEKKL
ncbi:MAG: GNAT family N-acetyltransferase [Clostridia bacterium]|nr:GNAT family N-acetyltransferase [Clostridia bacterium]MBQ1933380.1 GNAT family N-acetyltransferase [Clostridia bacterium]MBQ5648590.1 GNAT family N-acetyltransferase [Clostridia bacterium]MBR0327143.1 GNAT family N-acetyltransferase [Clostridia bacterium]